MSSFDVDEILNKLSTKFNRIFYDREFVCCVNEDFQVILKNKNKCCVVVFPVLGPSYLKAVKYQAKIFDLAVFGLGTGKTRSVAVCHKEFLTKNISEVKEIMPDSVPDSSSKVKKKRPERQLYVPPAQRRLPLPNEQSSQNIFKPAIKKSKTSTKKKDSTENKQTVINNETEYNSCILDSKIDEKLPKELKVLVDKEILPELIISLGDIFDYLPYTSYNHLWWRREKSEDCPVLNFEHRCGFQKYLNFKHYHCLLFCKEIPLFTYQTGSKILYILYKNYFLWQPKLNIRPYNDHTGANSRPYSLYNCDTVFQPTGLESERIEPLCRPVQLETYQEVLKSFNSLKGSACEVLCNRDECCFSENCPINLFIVINSGYFIVSNSAEESNFSRFQDHSPTVECYLKNDGNSLEYEKQQETVCKNETRVQNETLSVNDVIVLEGKFEAVNEIESPIQKNNKKNSSPKANVTTNDIISNSINTNEKINIPKKSAAKTTEHEEEKEIMRKTKEHINRKTRPIMKYVDDTNDTLKIGKNDNVNNWEDLFDDDGQLQDELFKEVVHKVGTDVTIVKAKEDYSEYTTKQIEELEHMVELYDFPSTFETHNIIQAFSNINSDAMYVKWVDDTHAILVLGSLTQAQKAMELDNPLIKVRPMTAASGMSLATAYKHDLKPAMKRPQTNLQTARRLITTHLGTKSTVSKEQNAKERDVLKAAREMKKMVKKNEQDAWDGNLRSSVNLNTS